MDLALPISPPLARGAEAAAVDQEVGRVAPVPGQAVADRARAQARTGQALEVEAAAGPDQGLLSHLARCQQRVLLVKRIPTPKVACSLRNHLVYSLAKSL